MTVAPANLFQLTKVRCVALSHRVVLAPMTRLQTNPATGTVLPLTKEYYAQHVSTSGRLLLTEGTITSPQAGGFPGVPGVWSKEQLASWKEVVDTIHTKNSFIHLQIADLRHQANPDALKVIDPSWDVVLPGDILMKDGATPQSMTQNEICEHIDFFRTAAVNAIEKVRFDRVKLHGANGFLIEQFLHNASNNCTDEYSGSPEKKACFILELVQAVSEAVGEDNVGLRLSPWNMDGGIPHSSSSTTALTIHLQIWA
ncbi:hypothetical protein AAF712_015732 [Marasmius tenuissimus]|uniref:NADH:flavin oxidoreductase/NADH oxidase N-terminal domain-containing protein n=1 Tax=Marasmius tenuissimus TaxID=585030 RepID=A0ABR2Z7G6_9AGAR